MAWKEQLLKDNDKIPFRESDPDYGRAEFVICPVYKRGKLKDMYIYPAQQRDVHTFYHAVFTSSPLDFSFSSYDDLDEPKIWIHFWCKEHKSASFRLYVPVGSQYFEVHRLSNFSINFRRRV